ncbi:hypothetical protein FHS18_004024 [Paenibacillus phyllosphaerae]|uniref:DUF4747 family protein n=1 Tax=Paenibacillus phyllosphaerae TaxID=274593 RepID=A0A7W5FP34_9BACL|nr:hypothetical protein [Paenibacillus phyllosphaerae]MBB3111956.1 hypothetical protein [Paenibacillus phyllosphaerae]
MPLLHYAKVNINSNIFDVYDNKVTIQGIMRELFSTIDVNEEYHKVEVRTFKDDEGEEKSVEYREVYNFSELAKEEDVNKLQVSGKVVRRYPIVTEEFDETTRTSRRTVLENNSSSILFYFDLETEIVVFSERQKFGTRQFIEAFQELLNIFHKSVGFEIYLLQDPFSMKERLENAYKIRKIKSTIIPPNVNEEALRDLYDKEVEEMKEAHITKKTNVFEINEKSTQGINLKSKMVEQVLETNEAYEKFARGYGKLEVEGENRDGTLFKFDSEKDSLYQTQIPEREKKSLETFIEYCKKGIAIFSAKKTIDKYTDR